MCKSLPSCQLLHHLSPAWGLHCYAAALCFAAFTATLDAADVGVPDVASGTEVQS
jgi:hypothetical protein